MGLKESKCVLYKLRKRKKEKRERGKEEGFRKDSGNTGFITGEKQREFPVFC